MSTEQPVKKPPWQKLFIVPSWARWLVYALPLFALEMLVAYPLVAADPRRKSNWSIFAAATVIAVAYGVYASRRIRTTVLSSDEDSYTVRLEVVRRRQSAPPVQSPVAPVETRSAPHAHLCPVGAHHSSGGRLCLRRTAHRGHGRYGLR
jgi:hypothetical protein